MITMTRLTSATWMPVTHPAASEHARRHRLAPIFLPMTRGQVCPQYRVDLPGDLGLLGGDGWASGNAMTGAPTSGPPAYQAVDLAAYQAVDLAEQRSVPAAERATTVDRDADAGAFVLAGIPVPAAVPTTTVPTTTVPTTPVPTTPVRTDKHDPGSTVWRQPI